MIALLLLYTSSPFLGLGYAQDYNLYNNKVCLKYNNHTLNNSYQFSAIKINSDLYDISKTFIDYYGIQNRQDCILNCNITLNLVSKSYLNSNFTEWTTGTFNNGNYELSTKNNNLQITGLYVFDKPPLNHSIYITDTGSMLYNYGIFSHEVAHYWFKRKCFNEGYYNELSAVSFHKYFMSNYSYFIRNTLVNREYND